MKDTKQRKAHISAGNAKGKVSTQINSAVNPVKYKVLMYITKLTNK